MGRAERAAWAGRIVSLAGIWSLLSIPLRPFGWPHWVDDAFGLLNVFAAPWFAAIYLLLFVSLAGCVLPRAWRLARSARAKQRPGASPPSGPA